MFTLHRKSARANEDEQWAELIGDVPVIADAQPSLYMRALIACLPEEERDIVMSYLIDGEGFKDIGQRYGYSDEWARRRFNRAIDAITTQALLKYRSRRT